jgi:hypothetical protein
MAAMTPAKRQALIEASGLFDPAYYLLNNGDVAASPYEPFFHYVSWGADENRRPSERFDPSFYAAECELQGLSPENCIVHYLQRGRASGLFATPLDCTLQLAGVPVLDLVQQFESWGRDCEFGLFQRHLGAEPNDLFRFADPTPDMLVKLIRTDFAGFGEQAYVDLDEQQPRREWFVVDRETRISRHTRIFQGDMPQEKVQKTALLWTQLLRAKAVREIAAGQKVYVVKTSQGDLGRDALAEVATALRSKGPGWVLWVEAGEPVGHCEIVMDGLLHARIDRLCPRADEYRFSTSGWLRVICAAWNMMQRENASVARGSIPR